ncbi:MAG: peptide-methionine (S)-S-oxide reductase MsrA [Longimicrobiales bacterium]
MSATALQDGPTIPAANAALATFAGGCFWCMEPPFDAADGVLETLSGYTGGHRPKPTYEQVVAGVTGHAEAVQVRYDPRRIGYEALLDIFWRNIDPTTAAGQFCDIGAQYRPAIFYHDEEQRRLAEASRDALLRSGRFPNVAVEIAPAAEFWPAEAYHQDYYRKNPLRYALYHRGSGRERRLANLWRDDAAQRRDERQG